MKVLTAGLTLIIWLGMFVFVAEAQTQRRKKNAQRRNNTAARAVPNNSSRIIEPEVVSTAEELEEQENGGNRIVVNPSSVRRENGKQTTSSQTNPPRTNTALQREVNSLRQEVKALREKSGVEDLEKLSLAEERAENFRRKLEEAIAREAELSGKMQQLEYQARPEVIQLETAVIGSTRPEEVRETRRKMLEADKGRLREQINQSQISRSRLETAVSNADALVEKLRAKVEAAAATSTDSAARLKPKTSVPQTTEPSEPSDDEESNPPL